MSRDYLSALLEATDGAAGDFQRHITTMHELDYRAAGGSLRSLLAVSFRSPSFVRYRNIAAAARIDQHDGKRCRGAASGVGKVSGVLLEIIVTVFFGLSGVGVDTRETGTRHDFGEDRDGETAASHESLRRHCISRASIGS